MHPTIVHCEAKWFHYNFLQLIELCYCSTLIGLNCTGHGEHRCFFITFDQKINKSCKLCCGKNYF